MNSRNKRNWKQQNADDTNTAPVEKRQKGQEGQTAEHSQWGAQPVFQWRETYLKDLYDEQPTNEHEGRNHDDDGDDDETPKSSKTTKKDIANVKRTNLMATSAPPSIQHSQVPSRSFKPITFAAYSDQPEIWFNILENDFAVEGITDEPTKARLARIGLAKHQPTLELIRDCLTLTGRDADFRDFPVENFNSRSSGLAMKCRMKHNWITSGSFEFSGAPGFEVTSRALPKWEDAAVRAGDHVVTAQRPVIKRSLPFQIEPESTGHSTCHPSNNSSCEQCVMNHSSKVSIDI